MARRNKIDESSLRRGKVDTSIVEQTRMVASLFNAGYRWPLRFAFFGSEGAYCYNLDGRSVWKAMVGKIATLARYGCRELSTRKQTQCGLSQHLQLSPRNRHLQPTWRSRVFSQSFPLTMPEQNRI
jgi:hypothetical protein